MDLSFLNPELPLTALEPPFSADKALRIVVGHCLEQIVPNAARIASGSYNEEHVHQLRVGLRRLRSALHLFEGWAALPDAVSLAPLRRLFRELGLVRDQTVLGGVLRHFLRETGAPRLVLPMTQALPDPARRVRAQDVNGAVLQLIAFVSAGAPPTPSPPADALDAWMARRLARWHQHIQREGARFVHLPESRRHALRKRVKTLRYAVEFVAPLFPPRQVARYLKQVRQIQDALGRYVDLSLLLAWIERALPGAPRAALAVAGLTARREAQSQVCAEALAKFKKISPLRFS